MTIAATMATYFLIVFFTFGCCVKLLSVPDKILKFQMEFFEVYGLTRLHMYLIGLTELLGIIAMFYSLVAGNPLLAVVGAGAIFITSLGALYFHFRYDEAKHAVPAVLTFLMSSLIMIDAYSKM